MSEYHKIETLYERDEHFKIGPDLVLRNRVYDTLKTWRWTEKVDGTNIRVIWQGGKLSFGGKTDNASIPADLVKWLYENITPEKLAACFPDGGDVVIYGEGYGAGIQRGGLYGPTKKFIVFDVFVIDTDIEHTRMGGWWLSDENMRDVASKLGLDAVPYLGEMTLEDATDKVRAGFRSSLNGGLVQVRSRPSSTRRATGSSSSSRRRTSPEHRPRFSPCLL
jgi:ATP-dependent RNA circularization protein (DNA/RNA ligase family)